MLDSSRVKVFMLRRIGLWAFCGFSVALLWALAFYLLGPSYREYPSQGAVLHDLGSSAILRITVPVALLGRHHAITWYWSAVINAAIYAVIGLSVETLRLAFQSGVSQPGHQNPAPR